MGTRCRRPRGIRRALSTHTPCHSFLFDGLLVPSIPVVGLRSGCIDLAVAAAALVIRMLCEWSQSVACHLRQSQYPVPQRWHLVDPGLVVGDGLREQKPIALQDYQPKSY